MKTKTGFTLIEVLLALAIIAIALTALLKSMSVQIAHTYRLQETSISHWVAMQGVTMIQLGLKKPSEENTYITTLLGKRWYWRAKITKTPIAFVNQIVITVSNKPSGPFGSPLIAYQYEPE